MEMYNYKTIHFMYEVWYMYVYSCSEGREGSVPPPQCLIIRVHPYLIHICIYYVCLRYYTHTNGYRTHTIITIKNIVGCKINCIPVKYLIRQSKIKKSQQNQCGITHCQYVYNITSYYCVYVLIKADCL